MRYNMLLICPLYVTMDKLEELIRDLGLEELINIILVCEDIRPAMLIQPSDYKEFTSSDKKTKSKIYHIRKHFPSLILSEDYNGSYQGIIVSKKTYDGDVININDMGKILGYPYYNDFINLDCEKNTYSIRLQVVLTNNRGIAEIFSNICPNNYLRPIFDKIAKDATIVLKTNDLIKSIIDTVEVIEYVDIPTTVVINKLINNIDLNQNDKNKILNIIYNIGFSFEFQLFFRTEINYKNNIHIGIIISLLIYYKNNPMESFYPLQNHGKKICDNIQDYTLKWESDLLNALHSLNY